MITREANSQISQWNLLAKMMCGEETAKCGSKGQSDLGFWFMGNNSLRRSDIQG